MSRDALQKAWDDSRWSQIEHQAQYCGNGLPPVEGFQTESSVAANQQTEVAKRKQSWTAREDKARLVMLLSLPEAFGELQLAFSNGFLTANDLQLRRQHLDAKHAEKLRDPFAKIVEMFNDYEKYVFAIPCPEIAMLKDYLIAENIITRRHIFRDVIEIRSQYSKLRTQFSVAYERFHRSGEHVSDGNMQEVAEFAKFVGNESILLFMFVAWRETPATMNFSLRLMPSDACSEVGLPSMTVESDDNDGQQLLEFNEPPSPLWPDSNSTTRSRGYDATKPSAPSSTSSSSEGGAVKSSSSLNSALGKRKKNQTELGEALLSFADRMTAPSSIDKELLRALGSISSSIIHRQQNEMLLAEKKLRLEILEKTVGNPNIPDDLRNSAFSQLMSLLNDSENK